MTTRRGKILMRRIYEALDILVRSVAVLVCLPLFIIMLHEVRRKL